MNIESIVKNNLCTGCGACISEDEYKQAKMIWDENGFLVPVDAEDEFVSLLVGLINDDELREKYIESSYRSSKSWNDEKITNIWMSILK